MLEQVVVGGLVTVLVGGVVSMGTLFVKGVQSGAASAERRYEAEIARRDEEIDRLRSDLAAARAEADEWRERAMSR